MNTLILNPQTLISATAATTSTLYPLDCRGYPAEQVRSFIVTKASGDTIDIEVAATSAGPFALVANVSSAAVSAAFQVAGSWPYLRAIKGGTNGLAVVFGMI